MFTFRSGLNRKSQRSPNKSNVKKKKTNKYIILNYTVYQTVEDQ